MLLHACGVFEALPGRLGGLQEPPGASRGLQDLQGLGFLNEKCAQASNLAEAEISRGMVRLD